MYTCLNAGEHGATVEGAASAVNYQVVARKIFWEIYASNVFDSKSLSDAGAKQTGNLHRADILFNGVMSTGFCDKHAGVFREFVDSQGS